MAHALAALGLSQATSYACLSHTLSLTHSDSVYVSLSVCVCVVPAEVTKYENDCASGSAVVACHMCAMYIGKHGKEGWNTGVEVGGM